MIPNNILGFLSKINPNIAALQNMQTPDEVAQFLLNSGRVNQAQVNQAKQMWGDPNVQKQLQSNPMFQGMFKN